MQLYFSPAEAKGVIDDYFMAFPKLKAWLSNTQKFIQANGFIYEAVILVEKEDYQMYLVVTKVLHHMKLGLV